jgi:4-diphosphocytidyl-2-C-methyl-D-erythritol kinase
MRSVTAEAFAKINLTLEVLGTRPDGFHDVRTVLQTIDLSDRIRCVVRPGPMRLRCRARGVPLDRTNTVWRAAEALWRVAGGAGEPRDVTIEVTKRIPSRAGLGGGSSDAAASLLALSRLWGLKISRGALAALGATIGADVPFFLCGGAALGVGRGDVVYPLADLPHWFAVVAVPPFGVSTAEAYGWQDHEQGSDQRPAVTEGSAVARTWLGRLPTLANDLETPVARRHPEIAGAVGALRRQGALLAAMSGSGSAVFGLFPTRRAADRARRGARFGPGWRARVVGFLARSGFERRTHPRALPRNGTVV